MFGAVLGDYVGSRWEFFLGKPPKDFRFFTDHCEFTDDSVCTAAVADILLNDRPPAFALQDWCRRYPYCSWGGMFGSWIFKADPRPYGSYGNGSAMRVSPAAFLNRRRPLADALAASDRVTRITHDHPEGMKGARAATHAIWLAYQDEPPEAIRRVVEETYDYDLSRSVAEIRPNYSFNAICQKTVPEAITCALEARDFEEAIRNAVWIGGDAETLAAIAGPLAEALHGIPSEFLRYLREVILEDAPDILEILTQMAASDGSPSSR